MIASDYFGFGVIATGIFILFLFSFRHFLMRLRSGSLRFKRSLEVPPSFFDEDGKIIDPCSSPVLHCIKGSMCVWCGKSVVELTKIMDDQVGDLSLNPQQLKTIPEPDFNSPTTATVKPLLHDEGHLDLPELDPIPDPMNLNVGSASAYCLRCKLKVNVLDPVYYDQESRRGVRRYLKGTCSVCKSKINAIVKKGD